MIQDSTEGASVCLDAINSVSIVSSNLAGAAFNVAVMNSGSVDLDSIAVSCISDTISDTETFTTTNLPGIGETKTYALATCTGAHTVRIAPIVKVGTSGKVKVCDYVEASI